MPLQGGHDVATQRTPKYWLDLFTGTTWKEFREAGASVSGFRASRWKTVQKIQPGDMLLCYLTGVSRADRTGMRKRKYAVAYRRIDPPPRLCTEEG